MTAESRGWGPGWPTNRLADQVPLSYITGRIHKDIHELVSLLCAETERRGYKIRKDWSWGYANRAIGMGQVPSNHSWGLAVDINAPVNPQKRPLTTDMPSWLPKLWKSYGFNWGGDYTRSTPDPMHFEFMGTPTDAKIQTERARKELTTSKTEDWDVLKRGDKSAQVSYFQRRLNEAHPENRLKIDGDFGQKTEDAVKRVQANVGFEQTGVLDMATAIYTQALAHSKKPPQVVVAGLTVEDADKRYALRGSNIKIP